VRTQHHDEENKSDEVRIGDKPALGFSAAGGFLLREIMETLSFRWQAIGVGFQLATDQSGLEPSTMPIRLPDEFLSASFHAREP
jgi:hypothetical protein